MSNIDDVDEVLTRLPQHLIKASDPTRPEEITLLADQMARKIQRVTKAAEEDALSRILRGKFDPASIKGRIQHELKQVGVDVTGDIVKTIGDFNENILQATKIVAGKRVNIDRGVTDEDRKFIDWLSTSQGKFMRSGYKRIGEMLAGHIVDHVLSASASRTEVGVAISDELNVRTKAYADTIASVATVRSRSWGQLSTFADAGVEQWKFQAVMDGLTCFAPNTEVLTPGNRRRAISKLKMGDDVVSCYGRTRPVARAWQSWTKRWMKIVVQDHGEFNPTHNHLFLTDKGWVRAEKLKAGDRIVKFVQSNTKPGSASGLWSDERDWLGRLGRMDPRAINTHPWPNPLLHKIGTFAEVLSVEKRWEHGECFDIEVHEDHGYTVGGLIVHNSDVCMFLNNEVFSVPVCYDRMLEALDDDSEEGVRDNLPFIQRGITEDGDLFLYTKNGEERTVIAQFEHGKFKPTRTMQELESMCLPVPPLHVHCRSDLIPI